MRFKFISFILLVLLLSAGCSADKPNTQGENPSSTEAEKENIELTISAAASLEDAFLEIKPHFEEQNKHIKLFFNFGGSGALQKQIIQGAPVDIFFSAAEDKFDELVSKGFIDESQGVDLLENTLVLIIPKDSKNSIAGFQDLVHLGDGKLALGTPEAVPAGNYGKQALEHLHIWDQVHSHIVLAKDVRQVLTYVETGNVEAGLVYKTDALTSDKVKVIAEADPNSHDAIVYPVGIINDTKQRNASELFYQFLQGKESKEIFVKYGFDFIQQ